MMRVLSPDVATGDDAESPLQADFADLFASLDVGDIYLNSNSVCLCYMARTRQHSQGRVLV